MNIFYSLQFGFREKHSTNHALISMTESIRNTIDNGKFGCGVFIDLKKAFDTVNHDIFAKKVRTLRSESDCIRLICFISFKS